MSSGNTAIVFSSLQSADRSVVFARCIIGVMFQQCWHSQFHLLT